MPFQKGHPTYIAKDRYKQIGEKISVALKERFKDKTKHPLFGKHRSIETKRRISLAQLGKHKVGHPQSAETRAKISESQMGEKNCHYGKPSWNKGTHGLQEAWNKGTVGVCLANSSSFAKGQTPWNKGRKGLQAAWNKGKVGIFGPETIAKMSLAKKGKSGHPISEELKGKIAEARRAKIARLGYFYSPESIKAMLTCQKPNKAEKRLTDIIDRARLPYRFVGNGEVILGGKCPDFINVNGKKQVIELFGAHWHPLFDVAQRTEHFRQYGFDTLVLWEDELKDEAKVARRIKTYARSH